MRNSVGAEVGEGCDDRVDNFVSDGRKGDVDGEDGSDGCSKRLKRLLPADSVQ
jgi:hypothetical protein